MRNVYEGDYLFTYEYILAGLNTGAAFECRVAYKVVAGQPATYDDPGYGPEIESLGPIEIQVTVSHECSSAIPFPAS